jgi:DNA-binding NarL/FixJ family response regulator
MDIIRIMILEDEDDVILVAKHFIEQHHDMKIIGTASDKVTFIAMVKELQPDIALVDINLTKHEDQFGIDAAIEISISCPQTKIIMLSGMLNEDTVRSTIGIKVATNYLIKSNGEQIPLAIRNAYEGKTRLEGTVLDFILTDYQNSLKNAMKDALSDRDVMILELFYRGYHVNQIAEVMHMEPQSVRNIEQRVAKKCLGWKWRFQRLSTLELAERAKKLGLF